MTSFIFNGYDFAELVRVNDIQRPLLPALNTVMTDVGSLKGTLFNYNSYSQREIKVDYTLIADSPERLVSVKQLVAGKLFTDAPAQLIFSDSPDRYYMAILDGNSELDQISGVAQGTLTFLVPDGVAHAVNKKEFVAAKNSAGVLEVEVDNAGTEECAVNVDATFTSDNGLFAVVSPYSVMEVGSVEEVDGHAYQATDVVAKHTLRPDDKVNWIENSENAVTVYPVSWSGKPNGFGIGSFDWPAGSEGPVPNYTGRTDGIWVGPTLHNSFAANSNGVRTGNFESKWRFNHGNTEAAQCGRHEFNLQNGDTAPFAIVYRDGVAAKIENIVEFWITPPEQPSYFTAISVDQKKINGSWFEAKISKEGAKITFTLSNVKNIKGGLGNEDVTETYFTISKTFTLDWADDLPVDSTTYWPQAPGPSGNKVLDLNLLNFTFRWVNVDKFSDDPNRYTEGDAMHIDSENGKVYLNGTPILNDIVKGSEFIKVPPGKTKLQFVCSSFATAPAVKASIQEVFL